MRRPLIIIVVFATLSSSSAVAQQLKSGDAAWSSRGVFAFTSLVLDFQRNLEVFGPNEATLVDCSTTDYFCADAGLVHIVLPRYCEEFKVGETWSAAGLVTEVLWKYTERHDNLGVHSYGPSEILLLGSPNFPKTLYEYEVGNGVRGIYVSTDYGDIVPFARKGDLASIKSASLYLPLVTLDPFGRCATKS